MGEERETGRTPEPESGDGNGKPAKMALDRTDEGQDFVDQSKIDFDPDDGLLSGTAMDGTSDIPGPHEKGEDGHGDGQEEKRAE